MVGFGIIAIIAGIISAIYGNAQNNDLGAQFESLMNNGSTNPGDVFLYAGIVIAIIGVILVFAGISKNKKDN